MVGKKIGFKGKNYSKVQVRVDERYKPCWASINVGWGYNHQRMALTEDQIDALIGDLKKAKKALKKRK